MRGMGQKHLAAPNGVTDPQCKCPVKALDTNKPPTTTRLEKALVVKELNTVKSSCHLTTFVGITMTQMIEYLHKHQYIIY